MSELILKTHLIEKKMNSNSISRIVMKATAVIVVFVIFACSQNQAETMKVAWGISILVLCLLFGIDVYYARRNKKYEFEIYQLEVADIKNRKELAEIRGETVPDAIINQEIVMPSNKIKYPIVYYVIMLVLEILIRIMIIH